jgi:16S rRNA (guanine527-N7)-methyltransferase
MSNVAPPESPGLPADFYRVVNWTADVDQAFHRLEALLGAANEQMNLVGASTLAHFWTRHVIDSAQLLWLAPEARVWADIGSGAGFPGLVLGILLRSRAGAQVHLIESTAKRCRFLHAVVADLDLPCTVHQARAETLRLDVEIVTARACAPLDRLLGYAQPFFARGARGLFLKGEGIDGEISDARGHWRFDAEVGMSLSDPRGRILSIGRLARAAKS